MEDPEETHSRRLRILIFLSIAVIIAVVLLVSLHYLVTYLSLDIVTVENYADGRNSFDSRTPHPS